MAGWSLVAASEEPRLWSWGDGDRAMGVLLLVLDFLLGLALVSLLVLVTAALVGGLVGIAAGGAFRGAVRRGCVGAVFALLLVAAVWSAVVLPY